MNFSKDLLMTASTANGPTTVAAVAVVEVIRLFPILRPC